MKLDQLYSSSTGNAYVVTAANGKRLMIECGVTWAELQKALNYDLSGIVGCLLTHEHKDHSKAVREVMRAGIAVWASEGTLDALGVYHDRRTVGMDSYTTPYSIGPFEVSCYDSKHDAVQPFLYTVKCDNENLLFATDTSHIKQQFAIPFNIIAIECSYNKEYLQKRVDAGTIHEEVAKRLLTSHMEEKETARYLSEFCDLSKCREIHLLHCSADSLHKERIKTEFEKRFFIETRIVESASYINQRI